MSFGPQSLTRSGAPPPGAPVDYRLTRRHLIDEYHRGRLSRLDVCDAQPELLRAARHHGRHQGEPCPICAEQHALVTVTFVFGPRLPPHGRCITTAKEAAQLRRRTDDVHGYVVEVCTGCGWNHLLQAFPVGMRPRP